MKKMIGLALWLLAFLIPFKYAILDTSELIQEDGTTNEIKGLLHFVVMVALLFTGYALVDSLGPKPGTKEAHGH